MPFDRRRRRLGVLYLYYNLLRYEEKRWRVRQRVRNRQQQGDYANLLEEMRLTDLDSYYYNMRMSPNDFNELLNIVGPLLQKKTIERLPISPGQRLALTLRHLATGDSIPSLSFSYRIGKTTVSNIIIETTDAIWTKLKCIVFMKLSEENWKRIANDYCKKWNFPNCIGAIDGKHVAIQAPNNIFHSIILLAMCDANYIFTMVDIGAFGGHSDRGVFKNTEFYRRLINNSLHIPPEERLPSSIEKTPYVIVGDEAFPLNTYMMRPYPGRNTVRLPPDVRVFNYRLSRARRIIENTFGIMVSRWRILRCSVSGKTSTVENIVKATTCLHNWLQNKNNIELVEARRYCPLNYVDRENLNTGEIIEGEWRRDGSNILESLHQTGTNTYSQNASQVRETFKHYFFHEGAVPWQWNICNVDMNDLELNLNVVKNIVHLG